MFSAVTLVRDGGFDFSPGNLIVLVDGRTLVFPPTADHDSVYHSVSSVVAENDAADKARCEREAHARPNGELHPADDNPLGVPCWAWTAVDPETAIRDADAKRLPPQSAAWQRFAVAGLLPPLAVLVAGYVFAWVITGFQS
jgi:hypothetical protein